MPYKDPEVAKIKSRERSKKWSEENKERKSLNNKKLYEKDKDKKLEQNKKWRQRNRDKMKEYQRKCRYGITEQEYKNLIDKQQNLCYICKKSDIKLCIDHDHKTGTIRGLLCSDCNKGLGNFKDNINFLLKAVEYLTKEQGK